MKKLVIILLAVIALPSCEFFRKIDKSSNTKADVKKENVEVKAGDTSTTKKSSTNEWERWVFQPKDTNVININIPKQSTTVIPVSYERGSGTTNEQVTLGMFYNWQQHFMDSVRNVSQSKQTETKGSVLGAPVILALSILVFMVLLFATLVFFIIHKLKPNIVKNIIPVLAIALIFASCQRQASPNLRPPSDKVIENPALDAIMKKNPGHGNPHDNQPPPPPPPPPGVSLGCILIDANGQQVTDQFWNGGMTFTCLPATNINISFILDRVKQDYAQFPITVTTDESVFNTFPENKRMRCIITDSWEWYGYYGGVAYINSYLWYGKNKECFVFSPLLGNDKNRSDATSHECGHTLGLRHQSVYDENGNVVSEYNPGNGINSPIMGYPYDLPAIWWNSPQQNDTSIISNTIKQQ